ncbi:MAG: phytoene/squalene synthase family protein [Phyllobacteriaceae bacterium]|nr:phytoene/squalene synthase family protein [Phyllobacteriaceae bacterium]
MNAMPRFELDPALKDACIESIRAGSKSFHAASLLLPGRIRLPARALYAFCRASDDLVDDAPEVRQGGHSGARQLRARLDAVYAGRPSNAIEDRVFAKLVTAFGMPRTLPEALVEGFEWDEAGIRYQTIDDLIAYATRVASTVGMMMTVIMGMRERTLLARAADLGIAMQLTNIARDVGEDARRGRLYLPLDWLDAEGIDADALLANPAHGEALGRVVARLLAVAETYYSSGLTGVCGLPLDCRPAIRSAAYIYREIGREIARAGHNTVDTRAHTSTNKKIELIVYATAQPFQFAPVKSALTHPAAQFLVDAAAAPTARPPRGLDEKAGRLIELLALAEGRKRASDTMQQDH